jgi:hypothetical protein
MLSEYQYKLAWYYRLGQVTQSVREQPGLLAAHRVLARVYYGQGKKEQVTANQASFRSWIQRKSANEPR